jgi:predicted nuclease with TOPRIM domain
MRTTPTHPELCNHCKPLVESSNLEWIKVGGQSVSIPKEPLRWVLRDKYSDGVINANANYSQQLAAKSRELTAVTEQLDSYKERYTKLAGKYAIEMHEITEQRDRLAKEVGQLKSRLTQTMGAVTISRNGYVQELEQQRDRLAEASKSLLHYIKLVRSGDSPLIHAALVESVDLATSRLDEALQSLTPKS